MGGNIFKNSKRIDQDEFKSLSEKLLYELPSSLNPVVIPSYELKESFGDIDVVIDNRFNLYLDRWINKNELPSSRNGSVTSILYHDVQVDLIAVDPQEYSFAYHYFAYNDLGNLIGRIARTMGFKFGHNGLFYIIRDTSNDTRVIDEILVTREYSKAINFLGFKHQYDGLFKTLDDVFNYVMDHPFAHPDIFLLENRNHTSRVRDRKRKTYMLFLDYLKSKHYDDRIIPNKEYELERAKMIFSGFKNRFNSAIENHQRRKDRYEKFNGKLVRDISGLDGKELGALMIMLKDVLDDDYLDRSTKEEVASRIKNIIFF